MIATTKYYDEFLRYQSMAAQLQKESNLGNIPHEKSKIKDQLMKNVKLYDVVERKYAGFNQLMLDVWYGNTKQHPYYGNFHEVRKEITKNFKGWRNKRSLEEMLYVFLVHRLTGSAIHYAKQPSGYHNTVIPEFYQASSIKEMAAIIKDCEYPKYTSVGYQFPAFPKPEKGFTRGGDYFMVHYLPKLCKDLANFLNKGGKKDLREVGEFMFNWNQKQGLRRYKFQYAAAISDIADFYPKLVNPESPFYYGTNAVECLKFMIDPSQQKGEKSMDLLMQKAMDDTGYVPYNLEDQLAMIMTTWI